MKKCRACQKEIDTKASKCPYCQTDQRGWALRHPIWTALILLFVTGSVANAVSSGEPKKAGTDQSSIQAASQQNANETTDNMSKSMVETFKIGDLVNMRGKSVGVNAVSSYQAKNPYMQPIDGNKLVAVDITTKNNSDEAYTINPFHFKLQDSGDYTYSHSVSDKEPFLHAAALQPGESSRGFLVFEIPEDNTPTKLIYTPAIFGTSQILIELSQ
jgi:hypothetical protein